MENLFIEKEEYSDIITTFVQKIDAGMDPHSFISFKKYRINFFEDILVIASQLKKSDVDIDKYFKVIITILLVGMNYYKNYTDILTFFLDNYQYILLVKVKWIASFKRCQFISDFYIILFTYLYFIIKTIYTETNLKAKYEILWFSIWVSGILISLLLF